MSFTTAIAGKPAPTVDSVHAVGFPAIDGPIPRVIRPDPVRHKSVIRSSSVHQQRTSPAYRTRRGGERNTLYSILRRAKKLQGRGPPFCGRTQCVAAGAAR
ncbi:MAG TPA: hypothetical protein DIW86_20500 [Pseudomonas sp.]|nr:hypothetical protein [Pseudomonas sp.]